MSKIALVISLCVLAVIMMSIGSKPDVNNEMIYDDIDPAHQAEFERRFYGPKSPRPHEVESDDDK